ncbi:oxidoreductase [Burkholderia stagnalis]|uniref:aldo/keto reductase n=1 Tax=Burkholderia stagnalis TaxID=1503054 RepID=UPI000F562D53|nr:oxidoreductase [Burkholderia stagnalis]RQQ13109.1 oxidoreductase [Burkholderia stagnalis]RQQ27859.1 oxidoreductase [Burkholderia stagnalis]RQQ31411.1 oxidoreductase [Burkholderia stagnalis]RQQ32006.1 oxidoreductase [Burkholderia stagnalis]
MVVVSMTQAPCTTIAMGADAMPFSRIVFGMWRIADWRLSRGERRALVEAALDLGVTSFDHADIYGDYAAESLFGDVLADAPQLRERMQLVTKCGIRPVSAQRPEHRVKHYDTGAAHVVASVEQSLRALRTDWLDLLLLHRPDPLMDADEVAATFAALRRDGKVRSFGISNFAPAQAALLQDRLAAHGMALATNQVECSLLHLAPLDDGTFDQAQRWRCPPMLWSPLAGGRVLTDASPAAARVRACAERIGGALGVCATTVLFAWLLALPCQPLPIVGSGRIAALREAVAATRLTLAREHWFALLEAARGVEVP